MPVTAEKARELVLRAGEFCDFIDDLLPEDKRRPRVQKETSVSRIIWLSSPLEDEQHDG